MKKTSIIIFFSFLALASASSALAQSEKAISFGQRSEEVKMLQEALKIDKAIYPEGLATGFFGQATKKAITRVQVKCGLPTTGIVDDQTSRCIFPTDYKVQVLVPNGGETWDRGQIQTIKWLVASGPTPTTTPLPTTTIVPTASPLPTTTVLPETKVAPRPIWSKASIDLFRRTGMTWGDCNVPGVTDCPVQESVFVKHLATVDLFAGSYSWKISSDIANGSDYVIRVSVGQNIVPLYKYEKEGGSVQSTEIWPGPSGNWDESDNPFTIIGQVVPPDDNLRQAIILLQESVDQLNKILQLLRQIYQIQ